MTESGDFREKNEKNRKNFENFSDALPFEDEKSAERPKSTARFGFFTTLALFLGWFGVVFSLILAVGTVYRPEFFPKSALYAGGIALFAGISQIVALYYCRRKYGVLVEFAVSMLFRTGFPLVAALVFFLLFDNILFKCTVLALGGFYLLLTPLEVWLSIPTTVENRPRTGRDQEKGLDNER